MRSQICRVVLSCGYKVANRQRADKVTEPANDPEADCLMDQGRERTVKQSHGHNHVGFREEDCVRHDHKEET